MFQLNLSNRLFSQMYESSYIPTKSASLHLQRPSSQQAKTKRLYSHHLSQKSLFFVKKQPQKVTFQTAENRIFR